MVTTSNNKKTGRSGLQTRLTGRHQRGVRIILAILGVFFLLSPVTGQRALVQTRSPATKMPAFQGTRAVSQVRTGQADKVSKPANLSTSAKARVVAAYGKLPVSFEANRGQTDSQVKFLARGSGYTLFLTREGAVLKLRRVTVKSQKLSRSNGQPSPGSLGLQVLTPFLGLFARSPNDFQRPAKRQMSKFSKHGAARSPGAPLTQQNATQALASDPPSLVQMKLRGINPTVRISGSRELPGKVNYFIGNNPQQWHANVPAYANVRYRNVYPGIDLIYHGHQGRLEYDFVVQPGANPRSIKFELATRPELSRQDPAAQSSNAGPAPSVRIAAGGDLVIPTGDSEIRFRKPVIYQPAGKQSLQSANARRHVDGQFVLTAVRQTQWRRKDYEVTFKLGSYNPKLPLVIDPTLVYSTFLGGIMPDAGVHIVADSAGNAYVVGTTLSANFPFTTGAYQSALAGSGTCALGGLYLRSGTIFLPCSDAFVAKVKADGSGLAYATYLGGDLSDVATGVAVDSAGNAYVAGSTKSSNFPTTSGAYETAPPALDQGENAFIVKLNPTGSGLAYSTLLGGSDKDFAMGIAIDTSGDAYVTGPTDSADFPTTSGTYESTIPGGTNPCVVTIGGFNSLPCWHGFVTELNPSGSALLYSTFLGGSSNETTSSIAIDSSGNAYVAGATLSTDFPTLNAYQSVSGGGNCLPSMESSPGGQGIQRTCSDAFVTKLSPDGSGLLYSTYLGGSSDDAALSIAVDPAGHAYVTGITNSSNFPATSGSLQPAYGGGSCVIAYLVPCPDAFITKLNATGNGLVYSSYLGGNSYDLGTGVAVDATGNAIVVGATSSTNFPTVSPLQNAITGTCRARDSFTGAGSMTFDCPDAFVAEIGPSGSAASFSTFLGGDNYDLGLGAALDDSGGLYITGITISSNFPTVTALQPAPGGLGDAFVAKISGLLISTSAVTLSPITLSFGSEVVGSSSASQDVTLTNAGGSSLAISGISITGADSGDFSQSNTCGNSLAGGSNCTISVTFTPTTAGSRGAMLMVSDDDASSPQTAEISGNGQDFTLATRTTSQSTVAGGEVNYDLVLTPQGGFNQSIDLSCSGAPSNSTCNITPASVTLDGSTEASFQLNVSTSRSALAPPDDPGNYMPPARPLPLAAWLAVFILLGLFVMGRYIPKGSRVRRLAPFAAFALLLTLWAACGGGKSSSSATPVGSYSLTVTATSGSLTHTTKVTLNVQ